MIKVGGMVCCGRWAGSYAVQFERRITRRVWKSKGSVVVVVVVVGGMSCFAGAEVNWRG